MREQRVNAGLGLGRVEGQGCLSVLLQDGVVVIHHHRTVRIPGRRRPYPQDYIVEDVRQRRSRHYRENDGHETSPEPHSQIGLGCLVHAARL